MEKSTHPERTLLPQTAWQLGRRAGALILAGALLAGCTGEEREYSGGRTRSVAQGVDVYDDSGGFMPCGTTSESGSATPIGQFEKVDNVGGLQDGDVMQYEFSGEALALTPGHSCEGSVWVHSNQAPAA